MASDRPSSKSFDLASGCSRHDEALSDPQVSFLAIGVWCAALVPVGGSRVVLFLVLGVAAVAWWMRSALLLVLLLICSASLASGEAWASLGPTVPGSYEGQARLVSDPEPTAGGVRVVAEIDGVRYDMRAWGSPAGHLRNRLMGELVSLDATLRPLVDPPLWLRAQGIGGRGTVKSVAGFTVGRAHTRLANSIRRTIEAGTESMSRDERSLFAGLVYGDDRSQSPLVADNFNAAGLTHLLAVSGQNVAFVLAIAGPVLRRLGYRPRFVFVVAVLLLFATVTRFEPSVVRASVMTAVAAVGSLVGAEVSSRRVLGLAITALILVDPLIVHSVAFQLSVAASAGILFWSRRVARAIPGPRPLVESLAVTATAQLAVAPLIIWRFGGLPVAALPANVLAGPAAGPVMMWGLTSGWFAGLVPPRLAEALHLPTRAALWWIDSVAAWTPRVPLGELGAAHIVVLFGAGWFGLRRQSMNGRVGALAVVIATLVHPGLAMASRSPATVAVDHHSTIWRDAETTVLDLNGASRPEVVLRELRRSGVGDIDLIVMAQSSFANANLAGWIAERHHVAQVWAPEASLGVGETVPPTGAAIIVDGQALTVVVADGGLDLVASG